MSEITRDVIIDLLPTYFSGEASEQTRQIVEDFFEHDLEFARMAQTMNDRLLQAIPAQLPEDHQMQTLRRTQKTIAWRVIAIGIVLTFITMVILIGMVFLMLRF